MNHSRDTIIFDMDGLMVNTEPISRQAWDRFLRPYGAPLTDEMQAQIIGLRGDNSAAKMQGWYQIPLTVEEILCQRRAIYDELLGNEVPVMPGLFALHEEISQRGLRWGVGTSSPRRHAEKVLHLLGLDDSCGAIAAGDEVTAGKPAPDIYQLTLRRLGVTPQQCLAIEDSGPGSAAAVAAGLRTVAVPHGETLGSDFGHVYRVYPSLKAVLADLDILLMP
jgi:HAD superfamily hydrolase (TIGR01509 family)